MNAEQKERARPATVVVPEYARRQQQQQKQRAEEPLPKKKKVAKRAINIVSARSFTKERRRWNKHTQTASRIRTPEPGMSAQEGSRSVLVITSGWGGAQTRTTHPGHRG